MGGGGGGGCRGLASHHFASGITIIIIPNSGKPSRNETFTFFAASESSVKGFSANFFEIHNVHVGCMRVRCACARANLYLQSAKVFSTKLLFVPKCENFLPRKALVLTYAHNTHTRYNESKVIKRMYLQPIKNYVEADLFFSACATRDNCM